MTKNIKRYKFNLNTYNILKFKKNNKIIKIDFKKIKKKYNLLSIIKFLPIDFKLIKKNFIILIFLTLIIRKTKII